MNKKRILITGVGGFLGANLARFFIQKNFEVWGLVKKETNLWRIKDLKSDIYLQKDDLSDFKKLHKKVIKIAPKYIIHLAAYGSYPNQENIQKMIDVNIQGTYNLLEATKNLPYNCLINTGSSSEYGFKKNPMKESDLLEPVSFYGATKASSTLLCQLFARQFKKPIINFRLFSVYGPYEEPMRLIPTAIKAAILGNVLQITSGAVRRDFIHIEDVNLAYDYALTKKLPNGEIFNIGTGKQYTNIEVSNIIRKYCQPRLKIKIGAFKKRPWDTNFWVADISKTKKLLGWQPQNSLKDGLQKTYNWFKKNLNLYQL
jgi:nucleoside-diphosphate-sugar epimerase